MLVWYPASGQTTESAVPVGEMQSTAHAADGSYISWREHIIDDTASAGVPVSGSDGLVMADLDGDGHEDIVSVHESDTTYNGQPTGQIRIAFGSIDPDAWTNVTLADGPEAAAAEDAAIADVNGDGHPDIVAACELAHLIYFQNPGREARTARWPRVIPTIAKDRGSFIRVFLADFNGDGRPEAVAPNKGAQNPPLNTTDLNPISIFEVRGDPLDPDAWGEHELGRYRIPQNSQPVDLDGDGDLDVVGGSRGEARVVWFENRGSTEFDFRERRIDIDGARGGGFNLAFEDMNSDGRIDIVLATTLGLAWIAQPSDKADPWIAHPIGTFEPDSITGFALADIDGDGDLDIMAGGYSGGPRDRDGDVSPNDALGRLGWFQNPGDPAMPWSRHDISRRKRGMFDQFVARDLDRDGDMDFISTRGNSHPFDGVFWLEQVRNVSPQKAFEPARPNDSQEMPLPG